jgi:hypothetical protein
MWRARFGRVYGNVVRQTAEWRNVKNSEFGFKKGEISEEWRKYITRNSLIYADYIMLSNNLLYCIKPSPPPPKENEMCRTGSLRGGDDKCMQHSRQRKRPRGRREYILQWAFIVYTRGVQLDELQELHFRKQLMQSPFIIEMKHFYNICYPIAVLNRAFRLQELEAFRISR